MIKGQRIIRNCYYLKVDCCKDSVELLKLPGDGGGFLGSQKKWEEGSNLQNTVGIFPEFLRLVESNIIIYTVVISVL